jgi:bifunctional UDP-N-acetylglucosamine pyrophosphorylase/glucosamine-1-phosphate N-acetyltransferase
MGDNAQMSTEGSLSNRWYGVGTAVERPIRPDGRRPLAAVIMAAGEGRRMRSTRPKPLHELAGRPMVLHVVDSMAPLAPSPVVVVIGHGASLVSKELQQGAPPGVALSFVEQIVPRGTGDALSVALTALPERFIDGEGDLIVAPADTPLLRSSTLAALVSSHRESGGAATVLTARAPDPTGYGRIVRGRSGQVERVVEHADADEDELAIDEVNTSVYCFRASVLAPVLRRLEPDNSQGEYYLTDALEVLRSAGHRVSAEVAEDWTETLGVNDRAQLATAAAEVRRRLNESWMLRGVTMPDPASVFLDTSVMLESDVTVLAGTHLIGSTKVAAHSVIGPGTWLADSTVDEGAEVRQSFGEACRIGAQARVGPYAFLGPGSEVEPTTITGPFYRS